MAFNEISGDMWKLIVILVIFMATKTSYSVILEPKFHSSRSDLYDTLSTASRIEDESPEDIPYIISINEHKSIQVGTNSRSSFAVNLNKAIPGTVTVDIEVYSGPGLISLDPTSAQILSNSSHANITYEANTFGDRTVQFHTKKLAGHAEIVCQVSKKPENITIDDSNAYISIDIGKSRELGLIISIVGWIYFAAWSLSFYFQVILNYQRKSVVGLDFDFLALNLLGFTCYAIYNLTLMFSRDVQREYYERNTYGRIPVEYNDLFFSLHAFLLTLVTVMQTFIYERGEQKVSIPAGSFIGITSSVGLILYLASLFDQVTILNVVLYLSYVKLGITLIKYSPQAYMNYRRQATTGWSIHNILLDFIGGLFSIAQMFLISYNYDDWISIFGNFTKFGLGVISIFFDIIFIVQHYILYKDAAPPIMTEDDSIPTPIISQSVRSFSSNRQQSPPSESDDEPTV